MVRGGVEPPTFRFSGLRITVQDRPQRSFRLFSELPCTPMDVGVPGCMRLEMRLCTRACGLECFTQLVLGQRHGLQSMRAAYAGVARGLRSLTFVSTSPFAHDRRVSARSTARR